MRNCIFLLLLVSGLSAQAEPLTIELQNNTPLFSEAECRVYRGSEALRAVYQMLASARFRLEIIASVVEEPAFLKLLEEKAAYGKSVKVYTNTVMPAHGNIEAHKLGKAQPGSLIITADSTVIGVGNIRLTNPIQTYSSFVVCQDSENFDQMKNATRKYTNSRAE